MKIAYIGSDKDNIYLKSTAESLNAAGGEVSWFRGDTRGIDFSSYDLVWVEYIGECAKVASNSNCKKLIIRTHGVEVYEADVNAINWSNVDCLVTFTEHQWKYFEGRSSRKPKSHEVIPLISPDHEFKKRQGGENKNVALVANITGRKGSDQIVEFLDRYPSYQVYTLGKVCMYGGPVQEYVRWNLERKHLLANWHHSSGVAATSMSSWLEDKSIFWLPSIEEAQSRALMEGMLKGQKPIIRYWAGAEELWPHEYLYEYVTDIKRILDMPYEPDKYRKFIVDRFGKENVVAKTKKLLSSIF